MGWEMFICVGIGYLVIADGTVLGKLAKTI